MLNFSEWRNWLRSKPLMHKWFIYLVIFRPIIDSFYFVKNISPFLSPLYIAAALTAMCSIVALLLGPRREGHDSIDSKFLIWTLIALINMIFLAISQKYALLIIETVLRYTLVFYLYFFLRTFIRSKEDIVRILQTFIYSEIYVAAVFLYELFLGPIRVETSRGFDRFVGVFADNFNYSFFIVLVFLSFTFLYLDKDQIRNNRYYLWLLFILEIAFLSRIVHIATWGIVAFVFIWFLFSASIIHRRTFVLLLIIFSIGYYYIGDIVKKDYVIPLTAGEMDVIRGEKSIERFAHGRMSRWVNMVPTWMSSSLQAKIIGLPVDMVKKQAYMFSGAVHNDFLRIIFLYGLGGFFCFLGILISVVRRGLQMPVQDRYLVIGTAVVLALYSLSSNALLYSQLLYIVLSVFAFAALPSDVRENAR